jgi:predicted nucleic acid-binding protein
LTHYPRLKAILQPHRVGAMVNNPQRALVLDRLAPMEEADDPFDTFLLAMAVAGHADYLVTGDLRAGLLRRGHIGRARILTPAAFRNEVLR